MLRVVQRKKRKETNEKRIVTLLNGVKLNRWRSATYRWNKRINFQVGRDNFSRQEAFCISPVPVSNRIRKWICQLCVGGWAWAIPGREMSRYRSYAKLCANICASIRSKNTSTEKHFVLEMPSYTSSLIKLQLFSTLTIEGKKKHFFFPFFFFFFFPINHLSRFWTKPRESQEFNVAANFPRYRSSNVFSRLTWTRKSLSK